jgi:hypothetical protein
MINRFGKRAAGRETAVLAPQPHSEHAEDGVEDAEHELVDEHARVVTVDVAMSVET